jgi:two-component system invasion response regulator UvrY
MKTIRLLLVDDHTFLRESISTMLAGTAIKVMGQVGLASDALKMINEIQLDCIMLDLSLPDRDGIDLIKSIRIKNKSLPILVLSMFTEEQSALRAIRAGANGYLNKTTSLSEIVTAVEHVSNGRKYISSKVAELLAEDLGRPDSSGGHTSLSDREYQYMLMAASGLTLSEIAQKMMLSPKTVSVYRTRALYKMNLTTTAALTSYVIKNGLIT